MRKRIYPLGLTLGLVLIMLIGAGNAQAGQFWWKKKKKAATEVKDSTDKKKENAYEKFIKDAKVTKGMFNIIRKKEKVYLEIPKNILHRDYLLSSRVSSASESWQIDPGTINRSPLLVSWSADEQKVYLHFVPTMFECDKNSEMYEAFLRGQKPPIWKAFKIETLSQDSSSYVIDATSLFLSSIEEFSPFIDLPDFIKQFIPIGGSFQSDRSRIEEVKAFDNNIIIKCMMTYDNSSEGPLTTIEARNIILLPEKPLRPRLADDRIGYFSETRALYSEHNDNMRMYNIINHWDVQPKPEDVEKYFAGELVEPAKHIVWYVDPAIPEKWRKYIKLGILDWNEAFEEIGFKNVIIVKDYPTDDPNFDPDDIRYNCYRYVTKYTQNSMGPSWIDPRSGEIICGDVISWYGVVDLLNKWRLIQTGAVDPSVRRRTMTDENMGEAMRYVAAHEIGHTLGLMHNFGASAMYPVEKLRDPEFTRKYGTTPSIMDYARFNYVAQPGDMEKGVKLTPPKLGVYDKFAIEYGYRYTKANTMQEDRKQLQQIVNEKRKNPFTFYGPQLFSDKLDPRSQAEDLSDNVIKANTYGIKNLKYVAQNFTDWVGETGESNEYTQEVYDEIIEQFDRYINHVALFIGGINCNYKYLGESIPLYQYIPKEKQIEAVNFILKNVEEMPSWAMTPKIEQVLGPQLKSLKKNLSAFDILLKNEIINRLQIAELDNKGKNLSLDEYFNIIYNHLFTKKTGSLSYTTMALQNSFVEQLCNILGKGEYKSSASDNTTHSLHHAVTCSNHVYCMTRGILDGEKIRSGLTGHKLLDKSTKRPATLKYLKKCHQLAKARMNSGNEETRAHYQLIYMQLNKFFN